MIDPQAKPAAYIKLLAFVALLGVGTALITFVFIALVHQGTALIWEQAAALLGVDLRLFTIVVCALGGLLVGLIDPEIILTLARERNLVIRLLHKPGPFAGTGAVAALVWPASPAGHRPARSSPANGIGRRAVSAS